MGERRGVSLVPDLLPFPPKKESNRLERLRQRNEALDRQEEMLQDLMRELDILNEEIVNLTTEYNSMLQQLKDLVLNT